MVTQLTRAKVHTVDNTRFQSPPGCWYSFVVKASCTPLREVPSTSRMFPRNSWSWQLVFNEGSACGRLHSRYTLSKLVFTLRYCNPGGNFRI